jgi:hypothetical protein
MTAVASVTTLPFVHRPPTDAEFEKFRLILSTYQDGTGMLKTEGESTLPGWRDFERSFALATNGTANENKGIYDVYIPDPTRPGIVYGASCKMRGTLGYARRNGRVTIEVSNAAGEFWDALKARGITDQNYSKQPQRAGEVLIGLVEGWHEDVSIAKGGKVDSRQSLLLSLQWDPDSGEYQLFQYPVDLPDPTQLAWSVKGRRLLGVQSGSTLLEWYGLSGGQLKFYPTTASAAWTSTVFKLEPIPKEFESGITAKAATYYPKQWQGVA